ncbi:RNA polymerase factor sigma-54 [Priestia flexa]|uniref:RNA polymerase factor sigma-54 n=1 Tax=Priestia flexa TaxID=86664 RepID=UPI00099C21B5|nr:RNA polymerase factor sigma-54 [Priestia flexa]AQX53276.1 RNA polymerase sigma-54 factor [Priestia flexa]
MEVGLFQQQSLKLSMSKELSQAISLLQYSSLDIASFIQEQAMQNPLIDFGDAPLVTSRPSVYKQNANDDKDLLNSIASKQETLTEHLLGQIVFLELTTKEHDIICYMIENLDEHGYLKEDLMLVAQACSCNLEEVEMVLNSLQQLDPIGVGARNLQECLLIQLEQSGQLSDELEIILTEYFQEFAYKKWSKISKECSISLEQVQKYHDQIKRLNPRPGLLYATQAERFIIPDYIIKKEGYELVAYANEELDFRLSVNDAYRQSLMLQDNHAVKSYLQEKYREFQWILKGIQTRKQTLNAIVHGLLEKQQRFFQHGPSFLQPLTMKELADYINVHESTVSRATTHKYIQTPFGTFSMKSFFTASLKLGTTEETSVMTVKELIKQLVEKEDKKKPLSDQQLTNQLLTEHDVKISRRTVAKYREQLNIASSNQRKVYV